MVTVRMNKLVIDMEEVESLEWETIEETDAYTVRFHTKSGKMYTRKLDKKSFKEMIEQYQEKRDD
tara:strand:+ start:209 stop:403 length:195 start_codon:yes stop_codon:yes gene_type:complete